MKVLSRDDLAHLIDREQVIQAVRAAFIAHSRGESQGPQPGQFLFHDDADELIGDCHIKGAQEVGSPVFAIKVASGFYRNPDRGLPVNNGLVLLFSAETGQPVALLRDDGLLTIARTAAAGALAAGIVAADTKDVLGIVGTGVQAEQQALWIASHLGLSRVRVYGRSRRKAEDLCRRLSGEGLSSKMVESPAHLCSDCRIVVTTTPATSPILSSDDVPRSTHIVAVGADSPGKQELDPRIMERASVIVTDDRQQCLEHGEFGTAYRAGRVESEAAIAFGDQLATGNQIESASDAISVVDLTGLGAQDLAIASWVFARFKDIHSAADPS